MCEKQAFGLQWHITEKCDQRCKHCYLYGNGAKCSTPDLEMDDMKHLLYNYISFCEECDRRPTMSITGGDPLLYKNIWEFLDLLHSNGISFSILGNPFHLDSEVASKLKSLGCHTYQMSLDGLEQTHDYMRKPGSFKETLQKIDCLKEAGITATIMATVSTINMNELPDLVDIVVEHGANRFAFARYCPNPDGYEFLPSPDEYHDFLELMWNKYVEHTGCNTFFSLKDHLWKLFLYEKGLFDISCVENSENLILDGCHCGICHMTLLTDGTVYACRRSKTPIGNALHDSFYDIFWGKKMEEYRQYDKFSKCANCQLRNFCRGCPSVAKCLTGNFYASDPQCWKK
ncbi:MAG: radical SAM/SPASM domain protein, ACGX system [Clostridia bacterium]|nr:radical SAM/SPASM domain protein, ACGX system [Clostridia bacterium]